MRLLLLLVTLLAPLSALAAEAESVAVLELQNDSKRVQVSEVQFLSNNVRKAAKDGLDPARFQVMTRETMQVLVPASEMVCLAGKCIVEIGKKLQAKYVVGGNLSDVGGAIAITLEAYESKTGMLTGTENGTAASVTEAITLIQQMGAKLIRQIGGGSAPAGGGGPSFAVTKLADVPTVQAVSSVETTASGIDFGNADVEGFEKYDVVVKLDKTDASADDKARSWDALAQTVPKLADIALARAAEWRRYAEQERAAEAARKARVEARDKDWAKLGRLLALSVVSDDDKKKWAKTFVDAYGTSWEDDPYVGQLAAYLPAGFVKRLEGYVPLPSGTFTMGGHRVAISRPFLMKRTEVTQGEWKTVMGNNPSSKSSCGADCPVENVAWWDAVAYANAVSRKEGLEECYELSGCSGSPGDGLYKCGGASFKGLRCKGYRLPTEAEWETAARSGGRDQKYPWGDAEPTCERAVFESGGNGCGRDSTWLACSKTAGNTAQGLCDMAGNVWEWVWNWYGDLPPTDSSDPLGVSSGSYRVVRGGSWSDGASGLPAAGRGGFAPSYRGNNLGFRLVRSR